MDSLRLLVKVGMMVGALTVNAGATAEKDKPDNATLIVGKWEVTKADSKGGPPVELCFRVPARTAR